jgi:elongation factor Ts
MSDIQPALVRELRDRSGAGIMDCKRALTEASGDLEEALVGLRKKGLAAAAKKAGRTAADGGVTAYVHAGGKIGVLVEVNCETDFVARTDDFRDLVKSLAMQIAATNAQAVRREDVDAALVAKEREVLLEQSRASGKPENILQKMVDGRVEKFYEDIVLLEQPYIKDPDRKVKDLLDQFIAKIGENIVVRRFAKFRIGEI